MNLTFIYLLIDPITYQIRYVGKSDNPEKRYRSHIKENRNNTYKENWIKSLSECGMVPIMEIIDKVPSSEWGFWESWWISLLKSWGFNLTNIGLGGEGGPLSKETKDKIRESKIGKKYRLGKKFTTETKLKMSLKRKGVKQSNDHILKRAKANFKEIDIDFVKEQYENGLKYSEIGLLLGLSASKVYRTLKINNLIAKSKN